MQRKFSALLWLLALSQPVDATHGATSEKGALRESLAAADIVVRGRWIASASGDHIRVTEKLEGTLHSDEVACQKGAQRVPAEESILLLEHPQSSKCTLIGSTGVGRQPQAVYIIGQTRFARGDYAGAAKAWRAVLDDGPLDAYNNLGYLLDNGLGVMRNSAEAVQLWRYAAERGVPESQIHLAVAYLDGRGVPKDLAEALAWARCGLQFYGRLADEAVAQSIRKEADRVTARIRKLASAAQKREGERRAVVKAEHIDAYWSERLR